MIMNIFFRYMINVIIKEMLFNCIIEIKNEDIDATILYAFIK